MKTFLNKETKPLKYIRDRPADTCYFLCKTCEE